jgi:hypothetical protein
MEEVIFKMEEMLKQIVKNATIRRRGGFKKDGSTHHSGIKNEHSIVEFLNKPESTIGKHLRSNQDHIIKHKGGTQTKADAVLFNTATQKEEFTISIKNHKTGTFDWLNSTKGFSEDLQSLLKERTKDIKISHLEHQDLETSRKEVDEMFSTALSNLKNNDEFIRGILNTIFQKYTDGIIIHHEKEKSIIYFEKNELKELQGFADYTYYLKHKQGTCSAQIMRKPKDSLDLEINTYLRVRLVLNNGVNALVGSSSKNKTSVPCIKIQQDNVEQFLNNIENKKIENYIIY